MSAVVEEMTQIFDPQELKSLAEEQADCFVTLMFPTHRHSPDYKQDSIRLKNLIAEAEAEMPEKFKSSGMLDEARRRVDDEHFWQHQLDGLAIFITPQSTRYRKLDFSVDERAFVNSHPLIRPLAPRFDRVDRATVLTLTWESAQLFTFRSGTMEADPNDTFPIRFDQISGVRDPEEQLQYHSQRQRGGPGAAGASETAVYHGHGEGERQIDADRMQYLNGVASAFDKARYGSSAKPVIVGTEEVLGHFKAAAKHDDFVQVVGSPAEFKPDELADRVGETLKGCCADQQKQLREQFGLALSSDKGSVNLVEVYQAARQSRVDRLLLLKTDEVWAESTGQTGEAGEEVTILEDDHSDSQPQPDKHYFELVNATVIETLKHGGSVTSGDPQSFELPDATAAALFRY